MASLKLKFRPSTVVNKEGILYFQIIHERKVRQLLTDYHIYSTEWDEKRSTIVIDKSNSCHAYIISTRERIRCYCGGITFSKDMKNNFPLFSN